MTRRLSFTKSALERIDPPETDRLWVYDSKTPGLAMMVTAARARSFYVYRKVHGRPQRIRLGSFPAISVEAARKQAQAIVGHIATGGNPNAERRAIRQQTTFGDAFKHYIEVYAKPHCKPKSWAENQRMYNKHLAGLERRSLATVTTAECAELHVSIGKDHGPYMANRVLEVVRKVINHARTVLKWEHPNPCEGLTRDLEHGRERCLDANEVRRLLAALKDEPDADARDCILMLLATGARKSNVEGMRWADVDLDKGTWRIEASESKNRKPLALILPIAAVELLKRRERAHAVYVFYDAQGQPPKLRKGWERVRVAAGLPDVHLHDIRRTVGSWLAASGATELVIARALGHKSTRSTQVYARLSDEVVRRNVENTSQALLTAGGEPGQGGGSGD